MDICTDIDEIQHYAREHILARVSDATGNRCIWGLGVNGPCKGKKERDGERNEFAHVKSFLHDKSMRYVMLRCGGAFCTIAMEVR
jgi:hypothetical protein